MLVLMTSSAQSWGKMFATDDGGKNWLELPNPPIGAPIQFFPDSTGWLVGGVHGDQLFRTQDGGQTWVQKVIPLPEGVRPYSKPEVWD
jgi:photosystem II stability/assembly factor-like uncharacterized protein